MDILFVSPSTFTANNTIQIHNLCCALSDASCRVVIMVTDNHESCHKIFDRDIPYTPISYDQFEKNQINVENFNPQIIHAWTPREHVRIKTELALKRFPKSSLIVHLEDNEEQILEAYLNYPYHFLKHLNPEVLDNVGSHWISHLSHPIEYPKFLKKAIGITGIIDTLDHFNFGKRKFHMLWPVIPFDKITRSEEQKVYIRKFYNVSQHTILISYTGNVHFANRDEVTELYEAILILFKKGIDISLLRTGHNVAPLGSDLKRYTAIERNLGFVSRKEVYNILNISDLLIQPGQDDQFNKYRLPSKIPEFLATGVPTIIPDSNIARFMTNNKNVIKMKKGNRVEISKIIQDYILNSTEYLNIGKKGKEFSFNNFEGASIAQKLINFYKKK